MKSRHIGSGFSRHYALRFAALTGLRQGFALKLLWSMPLGRSPKTATVGTIGLAG